MHGATLKSINITLRSPIISGMSESLKVTNMPEEKEVIQQIRKSF
jgi:hypothetical protein